MLLRVHSLPPQPKGRRSCGPRVLHGTSTKENKCLTLRYTPFGLASSGRALSGTCSGPAAFVNNRKKTSPHESILSGIKSRFGALARYVAALDEKAAARLSAADHPHQAVKRLETLLPLPETGTLLHFEAGDGGFLEAFHAARPGWELSAIESGDAFMRLLKKAFLRSAYNADYRDADLCFPVPHHRRYQASG